MVRVGLILLALCLFSPAFAKPRRCGEKVASEISRLGRAPKSGLVPVRSDGKFFSPHLLEPDRERIRERLTPQRGELRYFAMSECGKLALSVVDHPEEGQRISLYSVNGTPAATEPEREPEIDRLYHVRWIGSPVVVAGISSAASSIVVVTELDYVMVGSFADFFRSPGDVPSIPLRAKNEWFANKGEKPQTYYAGFAFDEEDEVHGNHVVAVVSELTVFHFFYHPEKQTLARHRTPARLIMPHYTSSPVQGVTVHDQSLRLGVWRESTFVEVLRYQPDMRRYHHDPQAGRILGKARSAE